MLRIEVAEAGESEVTLRLEGRVIGPWVPELEQACAAVLDAGRRLTVDCAGVSFVDRAGVALCRRLARRRAVLRNCSPFVEELLHA